MSKNKDEIIKKTKKNVQYFGNRTRCGPENLDLFFWHQSPPFCKNFHEQTPQKGSGKIGLIP